MSKHTIANARVALRQLKDEIAIEPIPRASKAWGGANVVVSTAHLHSGYREIITPYALEISWMIESLRDIFARLIDSCSKFEFYGRLEIAANRAMELSGHTSSDITRAMVEAADLMLDEMAQRRFKSLSVALGTEIAADRAKQ